MLHSDDLSLPCMIVDYLSDTDNIYQPVAHSFANFIASKLSPLADVEIARLTNNEISKLIHRLPEADIRCLIDDEISRLSDLFTTLGQDIYREFSSDLTMCLWSVLGLLTFMNVVLFISLIYKDIQSSNHAAIVTTNATQLWWFKRLTSSEHDVVVTSNAAEEQPKPSKKPILLLKYPGTPDLKGLKGIAETYIQENYTGVRQEVEQPQEGTSRVVVRSSSRSSIVEDPKSLLR